MGNTQYSKLFLLECSFLHDFLERLLGVHLERGVVLLGHHLGLAHRRETVRTLQSVALLYGLDPVGLVLGLEVIKGKVRWLD